MDRCHSPHRTINLREKAGLREISFHLSGQMEAAMGISEGYYAWCVLPSVMGTSVGHHPWYVAQVYGHLCRTPFPDVCCPVLMASLQATTSGVYCLISWTPLLVCLSWERQSSLGLFFRQSQTTKPERTKGNNESNSKCINTDSHPTPFYQWREPFEAQLRGIWTI